MKRDQRLENVSVGIDKIDFYKNICLQVISSSSFISEYYNHFVKLKINECARATLDFYCHVMMHLIHKGTKSQLFFFVNIRQ